MLTNSNYVLSQYLVVMMTALLSWGIIKLLLIIVTRYLIFFTKLLSSCIILSPALNVLYSTDFFLCRVLFRRTILAVLNPTGQKSV